VSAWDEVADLYGADASPFAGFAGHLVDHARVGPGERVLDIGCGNGLGLAALAGVSDPVAVGADASPAMLRACRRRVPGARLVLADARALPVAAGVFDVAVASSVLQFLAFAPAALAEWRRVLRPGGRLALSVPAGPARGEPDVNGTLLREFFPRLAPDARARLLALPRPPAEPPDLAAACTAAGFADAEVTDVPFDSVVASLDAWWDLQWTHGFRAFLRELDGPARAAARERAFDLLRPTCLPTGEVPGSVTVRFCLARA
jgi:SAM-dependent methyltransferase